jgi:hypothetical protein
VTQIIGDVAQVELRMYDNSDTNLDIVWWADESKTAPRNIAACGGEIKEGWDGAQLLDLATVMDIVGNIAEVRIPAATIADLVTDGIATYYIWLRDTTGEQQRVMMGVCHINA